MQSMRRPASALNIELPVHALVLPYSNGQLNRLALRVQHGLVTGFTSWALLRERIAGLLHTKQQVWSPESSVHTDVSIEQ